MYSQKRKQSRNILDYLLRGQIYGKKHKNFREIDEKFEIMSKGLLYDKDWKVLRAFYDMCPYAVFYIVMKSMIRQYFIHINEIFFIEGISREIIPSRKFHENLRQREWEYFCFSCPEYEIFFEGKTLDDAIVFFKLFNTIKNHGKRI